jgi:hypothetical protein
MGNSPLVGYTKISPNRTSPRIHAIDTVTIHCIAGQLTAKRILDMDRFAIYDEERGVSCNYAIGCEGSIGMGVEEKDRSWCTDNRENDNRAITIVVAADTTHPYSVRGAAYKSLINLLVDICMRNNIRQLLWKGDKSLIGQVDKQNMTVHKWFAETTCPGEYLYSRHSRIAAEVNERLRYFFQDNPQPTVKRAFEPGDLVSLAFDAKYYNGADLPNWVIKKNWYVKTVNGDRVIIDKSQDGKYAIHSAVQARYLNLIKAASDLPRMVRVTIPNTYIRKGPGANFAKTGKSVDEGVFTITEIQNGKGSTAGWGKLKSGDGWINLDRASRI